MFEYISPKSDWEFSWKWLADLIARILNDVFGYVAENEGWEA